MRDVDLLPPRVAARAKQLEFFARTRVESFLKGPNQSKLTGSSTDFMRHRPYMPGDDLRSLDWRVFARTERLVTRQYEEYTNVDVVLALDCSGSMGYEGDGMTKIDFVRHCAAMLVYMFNYQSDGFGLATMAADVTRFVRPSRGKKHLARVFGDLVGLDPQGQTDLAACVRQLMTQVRRRSVFLFFSDGYQDPIALTKAIGTLRLRGHDVVCYQVYDPAEQDLPFAGFTLFRDLETGQVDAADPLEIRTAYRQTVIEHTRALKDGCARFGIEFHSLPTSPDWDLVLARIMHMRTANQ